MSEPTNAAQPAARQRRGLGMGLSALLGDEAASVLGNEPRLPSRAVPLARIRPSRVQPRRNFDDEAIEELASSIRRHGVLQPLVVRPLPEGTAERYELIAGERRWRAAQRAGLDEIPVIVKDMDDRDALEIAIVENVQRQDLGPLEEAEAYRRLIEEFGHTQEIVATALGRSRSHIANMMRLLQLPESVRRMVDDGTLTAGHARALLSAPDALAAAREVIDRDLNVRETEALVKRLQERHDAVASEVAAATALDHRKIVVDALEEQLAREIGLPVKIRPKGKGGTLTIAYSSNEQLDEIVKKLA